MGGINMLYEFPVSVTASEILSGHISMRIVEAGWAVDIASERRYSGVHTGFLIRTFKVSPEEAEIGEPVPCWNFELAVEIAERKLNALISRKPIRQFGNQRKVVPHVVKKLAA
jgi:hypothetical protein